MIKICMAQFERVEGSRFARILGAECQRQKIDLVVFGEYVANRFFKKYTNKAELKREFETMKAYFSELARKLNLTIIVPLIECESTKSKGESKGNSKGKSMRDSGGESSGNLEDESQKFYKSIAIFDAQKVRFHRATRLMDFSHWNERAFFDNDLRLKEPPIFKVGDFKVSAIFGWEAHFDEMMTKLRKKGVDILCVPCANTFGSNARWQRLMQTRSFLNSAFVVRVNRVGTFIEKSAENGFVWDFYGESFVAMPDGSLGDMMGEKEGILVSEIRAEILKEAKDSWQFR